MYSIQNEYIRHPNQKQETVRIRRTRISVRVFAALRGVVHYDVYKYRFFSPQSPLGIERFEGWTFFQPGDRNTRGFTIR